MIHHPAVLALLVLLGAGASFSAYVLIRYTPVIVRIFTEKPMFAPLRGEPEPGHEDVLFQTRDGYTLAGTYFRARGRRRSGLIVFCHEFLGDRWSVLPYADSLRDLGFDLFSFDFRNHGQSQSEPGYDPLQWVSDRETTDLEAALDYLRSRHDHDASGFGLFGISRGGGTAIAVAANSPDVWGVVTDGAFPTQGTVFAYILRWAEIYVGRWLIWKHMPHHAFDLIARAGILRAQWCLGRTFCPIERSIARLSPRPLLMIHGQSDGYIAPSIARGLFDLAREPKEFWLVSGAKHNRCREVAADAYRDRVMNFFARWAPRRLPSAPLAEPADLLYEPAGVDVRLTDLVVPSSQVS